MRNLRLPLLTTALLFCVLFSLSCARDQELVSISVQPNTETFGAIDPSLHVQLRAIGSYIHPPATKDITNQVNWSSNAPQVVTITSSGLLSPGGGACGNAIVSATVQTNKVGTRTSSGAIVTASMNANVICPGASNTSTLTVTFAGTGSGKISSPGLTCTSSCTGSFATGTTVTLTATANAPSVFAGWMNCDPVSSGAVCIVALNNNRVVTVTFN